MKRSEINKLMTSAEAFLDAMNFRLPPWATRRPADWKGRYATDAEIVDNRLGWDLTDFGSGDFARRGLLLFTLRNGNPGRGSKTYAEKVMIVDEGQETPLHFHWSKAEDIIVRGGGRLVLELYGSTPDEGLAEDPVRVKVDGISCELGAGGRVVLGPGESICLERGVYHRFYGEAGTGRVLVGEVSAVNDDAGDNRFFEDIGRFPGVEEDEEPLHLLAIEYADFL
jgi:hypothetical protein